MKDLPYRTAARLPVALVAFLALTTAGCDTPLVQRAQNPYVYGCCFIIVAVLDILAILEVLGSVRPLFQKVLWMLVILFLPLLGLLAYYLFGRR